ncbi:MAG: DUF1343 domain-containing protein [Chitinophagales bacterium]
MNNRLLITSLLLFFTLSILAQDHLMMGADQLGEYLPKLKNKKIGIATNHTGIVGHPQNPKHIVDTLLALGVDVRAIFTPEHGFRGEADAGASIRSGKDKKTGLPIISLYGKQKKPDAKDLEDIDLILFDIQDVGARFYTYISTMHYLMEACAENNKSFIVLDRPNPNGFYVDGPVLKPEFTSFVGMHPVPIVHGMTVGEYAQMINGEKWLAGGIQCDLEVIKCNRYYHNFRYKLPIKPSPNLPNMTAIYLYPSLCLFEGTDISIGRGTNSPFQVIGSPDIKADRFHFTPQSMDGAKNPKHKGEKCYGQDLSELREEYFVNERAINIEWLVSYYNKYKGDKEDFFNSYFDKLAGTDQLRQQIEAGKNPKFIKSSWQEDLEKFMSIRSKYLLYDDFRFN